MNFSDWSHRAWGTQHEPGSIQMLPDGRLTRGAPPIAQRRRLLTNACRQAGIPLPTSSFVWLQAMQAFAEEGEAAALAILRRGDPPPTPTATEQLPPPGAAVAQSASNAGAAAAYYAIRNERNEPQAQPVPHRSDSRIEELVNDPIMRAQAAADLREAAAERRQTTQPLFPRTPWSHSMWFGAAYGPNREQPIRASQLTEHQRQLIREFRGAASNFVVIDEPYTSPPSPVVAPDPVPVLYGFDSLDPDSMRTAPTPEQVSTDAAAVERYFDSSDAGDPSASYEDVEQDAGPGFFERVIPSVTPSAGLEEKKREHLRNSSERLAIRAGTCLDKVPEARDAAWFVETYQYSARWHETWVEFETLPHGRRILVVMQIPNSISPRRRASCKIECTAEEAMVIIGLINETPHLAPVVKAISEVRNIELDDPSDRTNETTDPETT